jgi:hypothetical protein
MATFSEPVTVGAGTDNFVYGPASGISVIWSGGGPSVTQQYTNLVYSAGDTIYLLAADPNVTPTPLAGVVIAI